MNLEIITKADLNEFKRQIVVELKDELKKMLNGAPEPEYIKSNAAKKKLGCSDSKLEALRKSGKLPHYKLQGTIYYKTEDIKNLFENSE
jgi:hypothetical protein